MPLALDPEATFGFSLASDRDKPAETRPTFMFRHRTLRESMAFDRKMAEVAGPGQSEAAGQTLIDGILEGLAGWRSMIGPDGRLMPFDPDKLADIVTAAEAWELYYGMVSGGGATADEMGKSESQSPSSSEPSAEDAETPSTSQNDA